MDLVTVVWFMLIDEIGGDSILPFYIGVSSGKLPKRHHYSVKSGNRFYFSAYGLHRS